MKSLFFCLFSLVLVSCHIEQMNVPNERKGSLKATMGLDLADTKSFLLDKETAQKPLYAQLFRDSLGSRHFTFLNNYNNAIYFYDYDSLNNTRKIHFDKEGANAIEMPIGYHIKNLDSIYMLSKLMKLSLADKTGKVLADLSLNGGNDLFANPLLWGTRFPQYFSKTTIPFVETKNELLLTGQFTGEMPDSLVNKFGFMAHIDYQLDSIYFTHTYPTPLYGKNHNWGGRLPMEVFPQLHPDKKKVIYSFVPSHDLYLYDLEEPKKSDKVYAGSNFAGTISSFDKETNKMAPEEVVSKFVQGDRYCAILHDPFRKVYYRFLRKAFPEAPEGTHWKEKDIGVIIMDEDFEYLGETTLGGGDIWHWENSFVTEEGLNIEYIDKDDIDEEYLTLKIFVPKKLN